MSSTKIINVLKDDSFEEIFDLFKMSSSEEVIFILPKKTRAFKSERQFAELSREAVEQGKKIAIMCSDPATRDLASTHGFDLLADTRIQKKRTTIKPQIIPAMAKSVTEPGDELDDFKDDRDVYERDVVVPSDEQMGVDLNDDPAEEKLHIEGEDTEDPDVEVGDHEVADQPPTDEDEAVAEKEAEDKEPSVEDDTPLELYAPDDQVEPSFDDAVAPGAALPEATLAGVRMDGIVTGKNSKSVRVRGDGARPTSIGIAKSRQDKKNFDDIAKVWQEESAREGSIWSGVLNRGQKSWWSRLFAGRPTATVRRGAFIARPVSTASSYLRKPLVIGVIAAVLLAGAGAYAMGGSAVIAITPASQKLDFDITVSISDAFASVDPTFNKIPGQAFSIEKSVTEDFASTGEKEVAQKARGTITVYNEYGTAPQTLIATTRFETPAGLIFRTLRTITVPGLNVENGKTTPGSADVEVIADKPGDAYNISASKFVLPAFREKGDTARFEKFYGSSKAAMAGGASGIAKVVTDQDYAQAKATVAKKFADEVREAIAGEASGLTILDPPGNASASFSATARIDQATDRFSATMSGTVKTVGFQPRDLNDLLKQHVEKAYGLTVLPEKLDISLGEPRMDAGTGIMAVRIAVKGDGYVKIDENRIIGDLLGKPESAIKDYLGKADGVASARVVLSPFWISKMPKTKDHIKVRLDY